VKPVLALIEKVDVKGIAHITGGGFIENIPRMLPEGLGVIIDEHTLPQMGIFQVMERLGNMDHLEMFNIFNMGIGMVIAVDETDVETSLTLLSASKARVIGHVVRGEGVVITS
jgi:phosphoribosylformylglycinamidine cyclo-ligase